MEKCNFTKEMAETANVIFEIEVFEFLRRWARSDDKTYLENDSLRDFFLLAQQPLQALLQQEFIAKHLGRCSDEVYFDPHTGDPLLAPAE